MTGRELLEGMGFVEEELIIESQAALPRRKIWKQILTAAACMCIVMLSIYGWNAQLGNSSGTESALPNDAYEAGNGAPSPETADPPVMGCTDPVSYCIRLDPVRSEMDNSVILHSSEGLQSYCESIGMQQSSGSGSGFSQILDQYDDAYFAEKDLLLLVRWEMYQTAGYEVRSISPDGMGGWIVEGTIIAPEESENGSQWMIFVEVEKGMIADDAPIEMDIKKG